MVPLRAWKFSRPRAQRGQAIVELALIVPIVLFLLLIAIDFGRLFFTYIQLENAAREAAAYAAGNPTDSAPGGGIWTAAQLEKNSQGQGGEGAINVTVSCAAGPVGSPLPSPSPIACAAAPGGAGPGNTVTVAVSEPFDFITPFIQDGFGRLWSGFGHDFRLATSATAAVLGLAATGGTSPGGCTAGPTTANFTWSIAGSSVTVDASSSGPTTGVNAIAGYNWNWGDGTDPYLQEGVTLTHTYSALDDYHVQLTVENPCGSLAVIHEIDLHPPASPTPTPSPSPTPTATPAPTPTPTAAPLCSMVVSSITATIDKKIKDDYNTVSFASGYTGQPGPAEWYWDFGDGTGITKVTSGSTTTHLYEVEKNEYYTYTVKLYLKNGTCTSPTAEVTISWKASP